MDSATLQELIALALVVLVVGAVFGPHAYRRLTHQTTGKPGCGGCAAPRRDIKPQEQPVHFQRRPDRRRTAT